MSNNYQIPILQKTVQVVDTISEFKDGLTFSEILAKLDIPKTTLFRILQTLENENWLLKKNDRYTIGYMIIHYGLFGLSSRDIRRISIPYLKELQAMTSETAHFAVLSGRKSLILEVIESHKHIRPASPVGTLIDLHCSAHGKIFLAYNISEDLEDFYKNHDLTRHTPNTITNVSLLKEELKLIKKNGYSVDEMEFFEDIRCLAAPVWGKDNEVVGAVGITATTKDFGKHLIPTIAKQVISISQRISREMGNF